MKRQIYTFLMLLLLGTTFWSCTPTTPSESSEENQNQTDNTQTEEVPQNTEETVEPISFKTQEYGDEHIGVSYPVMQGGEEAARQQINKIIEDAVFELIDKGDAANIEAALEAFKESSEQFGGMLSINVNASDVYIKDNLISFTLNWSDYQGGAHGNSGAVAFNFDTKTGKRYTNDELILDKAAFMKLVEQKFRAKAEISETASLNSKGHSFEDNQFVLPKCIYYDEEALGLYYVPYEIAPYVMGGTELSIPYNELKGLILGVE